MSVPEFVFALELSDSAGCDTMVDEVAASVFKHAGMSTADSSQTLNALHAALGNAARGGVSQCSVHFRALAGELRIEVSAAGHEWHTSRQLAR